MVRFAKYVDGVAVRWGISSAAGALVELSQGSIGMVRFAKYVDGVAVR